jgi:hypothetical protein
MAGTKVPEKFFISLITTMLDKDCNLVNNVCTQVKSLYIIRNIFEQTCPFMVLTIELDLAVITLIEDLTTGPWQNFPIAKLYITASNDENFDRDKNGFPIINDYIDIYYDYVTITKCSREEMGATKPTVNVALTLINKRFFDMSHSYTVAKTAAKLTNVNAKDFLENDYMNTISDLYGNFVLSEVDFPETRMAPYTVSNKYLYDSFPLDCNISDLHIPSYIIQHYKPINLPSYWFFDDFYIDEDAGQTLMNPGGTLCHWLTFFKATDQFRLVDISSKWDANKQFNILSKESITDRLGLLQDFNCIDVCTRFTSMKYTKKDSIIGNETILTTNTVKPIDMVDFNKLLVNNVLTQTSKSGSTVTPMKFDVPENDKDMKNLYSRIALSHFYGNATLQEIYFYEFPQCLPNIFQFGEIYNLEGYDNSERNEGTYLSTGMDKKYTLSPCCIVNVFRTIGEKTQHMESSTYVKFLRINSIDLDGK